MADAGAPTADDKSPAKVREMFARVAPAYDRLNHLLSGSLDRLWRRRLARSWQEAGRPQPVLDLCCGTGDQAAALRRRGARVAAGDFCLPMLALARPKLARLPAPAPAPLAADALALPHPDGSFGAASVSFGLRNVVDLDAALVELARVLRPGGELLVLEFALPRPRWLRDLYLLYFRRLLPAVGALVSRHQTAYSYLPSSVLEFPQRDDFTARLEQAGFSGGAWHDLSGGTVCLYTARRV